MNAQLFTIHAKLKMPKQEKRSMKVEISNDVEVARIIKFNFPWNCFDISKLYVTVKTIPFL
jgi:hypothetical protein